MLIERNSAGAIVISETIGNHLETRSYYGYGVSEARDAFGIETGSKVECKRCGRIISAKRDGSPRKHSGFVNVCGVTTRQFH